MQRTQALKKTLESLARVYHEDGPVPVDFGKPSRATPSGEVKVDVNVRDAYGRDLSGAQELRLIANTLSHEIEHLHESDLTSKQDFMGEYPERRQLAGAVINILEDQYIDHTRTQRYPGLRKAQAFSVDAIMENHHRRPRVDNMDDPVAQAREAFTQLAFAGYVKGISGCDEELRTMLGKLRPIIREVRTEDDQEARKDLAHAAMDVLDEYLPEGRDADMPDECVVCEERTPVVILPLLGPVCSRCAPSGHGPSDGEGPGERPDEGERVNVVEAPPDDGGDGDDPPGEEPGQGQPGPDDEGDGGGPGGGPGGDGPGQDGDPGDGDDGDGPGQGGGEGPGEQAPVSDADDGREIDPREWEWLDLGDHEDHEVAVVDDDATV